MSKALKCDRCQKCFDHFKQGTLSMAKFSNPILQTSEERRLNRIGRVLFKYEEIGEYIDLCPDCTEFFIAFMAGCPMAIENCGCDKPDIEYEPKEVQDMINSRHKHRPE